MASDGVRIHHISDTATWVAQYRALESERPDALFHDWLAGELAGKRGREIAAGLARTSRYSQWSVVIRTIVIDKLIQKYVTEGVDMVINLGAGLDTRPYRLELPESLQWVEVDYAGIIEHKQRLLEREKPGVNLERIALDLSNIDERRKLFARLSAKSRRALVLTEGVIPYLTEEQVASLAQDLHAEPSFLYWIAEYYSPAIYPYFNTRRRAELMKNAPFRFFPADWLGFFRSHGWTSHEIRYLPGEAAKMGRGMPFPWWARLLHRFASRAKAVAWLRSLAYVIFARDCRVMNSSGDPTGQKMI